MHVVLARYCYRKFVSPSIRPSVRVWDQDQDQNCNFQSRDQDHGLETTSLITNIIIILTLLPQKNESQTQINPCTDAIKTAITVQVVQRKQ